MMLFCIDFSGIRSGVLGSGSQVLQIVAAAEGSTVEMKGL